MKHVDPNVKLRIGNLELRVSKPLFHRGKDGKLEEPTDADLYYEIIRWQKNPYYGNEDKYIKHERKDGNGVYYTEDGDEHFRIDEGCFKNPESCYTIATFEHDDKEDWYELEFCGTRPLELEEDEMLEFMRLAKMSSTLIHSIEREWNEKNPQY